MKIVVLTTCHEVLDSRIYYKQILSLLSRYDNIVYLAPLAKDEDYKLASGVKLYSLKKRKGIIGRIMTVIEAANKIIKLKPDICHFHDLDFIIIVPLVKVLTKVHLIYDVHEAYSESMLISPNMPEFIRPIVAMLVDKIELLCSKYCSYIITADIPVSKKFIITGVPVTVVYNYPSLEVFENKYMFIKEKTQGYSRKRILIYQGTMSRERGLFHMLDGMKILKEQLPESLLLLIGLNDEKLIKEVNEKIMKDGLINNVKIMPLIPHSEIASQIALAEIGLAPLQPTKKFKKNIPIKIFEYMACGVPILAANLPPIAQYIDKSGAGLLYDSTDAIEFAREAKKMLDNEDMRKQMSQSGRHYVERYWNWNEMKVILLEVYRKIEYSIYI